MRKSRFSFIPSHIIPIAFVESMSHSAFTVPSAPHHLSLSLLRSNPQDLSPHPHHHPWAQLLPSPLLRSPRDHPCSRYFQRLVPRQRRCRLPRLPLRRLRLGRLLHRMLHLLRLRCHLRLQALPWRWVRFFAFWPREGLSEAIRGCSFNRNFLRCENTCSCLISIFFFVFLRG